MVTLMTESNFTLSPIQTTLDLSVATRKRRRVVENDTEEQPVSKFMNQALTAPQICMVAPDFNCAAVLYNEIDRLQLSTVLTRHKAVVLFFYECDFTPSACKDLQHINNNIEKFQLLNTMPLAMSTDTEMVHTAFMSQPILGFIPSFPLVADTTRAVSRHFNVINPETGLAQRAAFIIDHTRQVRFSFVLEDNRILHSIDTICAILQTI